MTASPRNPNLDLVRAAAIVMVVLAHAAALSPVRHPLALTLAWIGQFGVDLFFVLSGWLIGGLFWSERATFGDVVWSRFFLRRALRTVPPYLVILPVAWFATYHFSPKHPPFDLSYLVFLQNYAEKIPFYSISWSLCVEEHFYLVFPALVLFALSRKIPLHLLFVTLLLLSPLCRGLFESTRDLGDFDRSVLATHLRLEGLVVGSWAAYIHATDTQLWSRFIRILPKLLLPALLLLALSPAMPGRFFYVVGFTLLAFIFLIVVGSAAVMPAWRFPGHAALGRFARISYSIYLTHSLVIHVARNLAPRAGAWVEYAYWPFVLAAVGLTGLAFYKAVEQPSLRLRDVLLPPRPRLVIAAA